MDNKYYQDDFEQFLQDEVKQHRMYPSDHIWKNIRTEIHGYKAWPALTFISLFIITALTISTLLINHPAFPPGTVAKNTPVSHSRIANTSDLNTGFSEKPQADYFSMNAPEQLTKETFANTLNNPSEPAESKDLLAVGITQLVVAAKTTADINHDTKATAEETEKISATDIQNNFDRTSFDEIPANTVSTEAVNLDESTAAAMQSAENATIKVTTPLQEKQYATDDYLKDFPVVNTGVPAKKTKRFGFQFYVTPSTSYRKLSDEKVKEIIQPAVANTTASTAQNVPLSSNYSADVNNVVRHKPAVGIELGFAILYNLSNRLKFKTGVQLNVRQYYIETFQSRTSDLTSLSLINARGIETINVYSPWNNNTGYKKTQLDNKVYQLSIPLGIQWNMIQGKHFGINSEASVQPTMTLNNNTYLLSTDYKHYTGGNEFFRQWNVNTSLGLNITYQSGANSWQFGPQIRYQHLPTYSNLYPIKEYLMDYGVRLGFTHQLK